VPFLDERVALLEKHIKCLDWESKEKHMKTTIVFIAPDEAQKGLVTAAEYARRPLCPVLNSTATFELPSISPRHHLQPGVKTPVA
jgi:hypothetical protein